MACLIHRVSKLCLNSPGGIYNAVIAGGKNLNHAYTAMGESPFRKWWRACIMSAESRPAPPS